MSKKSRMANAALESTGNKEAIKASDKKMKEQDVSVFPCKKLAYMVGSIIAVKNALDRRRYEGVQKDAQVIERKAHMDQIRGVGRDTFESRYNAIMQYYARQDNIKKQQRLKKKIEHQRMLGEVLGFTVRGINQLSNTNSRKAAYAQMIGSQAGTSARDLAIGSYIASDYDTMYPM